MLPSDPSWIHGAGYVRDIVACLAAAAALAHDHGEPERHVLPHLPYQVAADTLGQIGSGVEPTRSDGVYLMALPFFQLDALGQVLGALRRARNGDQDAAEVLDLVSDYTAECFLPPRRVDDVVTGMERALAVLTLDISAVRTVATTLLLEGERDDDIRVACDDWVAAWRAAGISHCAKAVVGQVVTIADGGYRGTGLLLTSGSCGRRGLRCSAPHSQAPPHRPRWALRTRPVSRGARPCA
ncbi:hypothetical protein [Streptomyces aquilus]|uniref:hypothetical protein n=1 Tax=Streptomyces aquilus TaxID=2548456 RepID=UPI0014170E20|nr:hypothetical protein [Streptomyces aquilus]